MKPFFCILTFSLAFSTFAQSKVDSLMLVLDTSKNDSIALKVYDAIGYEYMRINLDSALSYFSKSEHLSKRTGRQLDWAKAIYRKGTVYRSMNLYNRAEDDLKTAMPIFKDHGYTLGVAIAKIELATISYKQQKTENAVKLYLEAIPLARKAGNPMAESRTYNYLGNIYKNQKLFEKAIENYQNALTIVRQLDFKLGISACLGNLGNTYSALKRYDDAIHYLEEALQIEKDIGDKLGASTTLGNLGHLRQNKKEFAVAENCFKQSFKLAEEVGDLPAISRARYGLADNALHRGDFKTCIQQSQLILDKIPVTNDLELSADTHALLSKAYEKIGNHKTALHHAKAHNKLSDSLYNANIVKITNNLEAKYQNEQKTKEIALLESEKQLKELQLGKKTNERNGIIVFSLLLLVLAGLLYNQYRIKQKANKKLREMDTLKSNFFANISHEFRTPLTLIKGPIEQLEQNPHKEIDAHTIKMIRRNADRVLTLINQLLDLSKIDEGNLKLELTEGDVFQCLRAAAFSFNSHAEQRNIDYRIQIPNSILWANFDRDKLNTVVYNLLGNALKFSRDRDTVSFHARHKGDMLHIKVKDTGKGIPKAELPYIFDRFYQANEDHNEERQGTGIGLALSRELMDLMGGTLTVESELDKGSVFNVTLLLKKAKPIEKEKIETTKPTNKAIAQIPSFNFPEPDQRELPKVLLVEDNFDMRQFIKEQLHPFYKIAEATNGQTGLKKATAQPPDLIITDLMMPEMDGMEFCKKLKTNLHTSHIPVIVLTAKAGIENKIEGLITGADDYLTKPFDGRELLVRAKNLIQQRQKLRALFSSNKTGIDPKAVTVNSIDQTFLEKVLALLEASFSNPNFGVLQMQEHLGMSKSQLHRKLKALTNEAPGELLRNFRLKKAAHLLAQKADTVTQIAYKVGFNDLSYFTKCFKKLHGVLPSSY